MSYSAENELKAALPSGWVVRRIKEVAEILPSNVDKLTVEGEASVRLCNYVDTYKNERITSKIDFMVATATTAQIDRLSLREGDITITKDSESPWDIAVPALIAEDIEGLVCGYHLSKISVDRCRMSGGFLAWALRSKPINVQFSLSAQGITRFGLGSSALADGFVPCPPVGVQIAIASYLDAETARIDGLIAAKRELRNTLDGFARSTFLAEVTALAMLLPGKPDGRLPWIPYIPLTWTRCKVKHLVLHFDQGVSPQCESRPPDEGEWGVLKAGCINSGTFNPMESKALPPEIPSLPEVTVCEGDLIISRANTQDLVGRSAVAIQNYPRLMLSDKLYRLKVDTGRCVPEFVRRTMWVSAVRSRIEERATGASPSMLNIDRRTILELDLVLPPVKDQLALLEKVDERAGAIAELIKHVDQELALLIQLRSSTITDAVLGRIDVRST